MFNKLSVQATFTASLPLLVLLLAAVAVAGILNMDRSQPGVERIDHNALPGLSAVKQHAPGRERVRLPNAADEVALTLASEVLNDEAAAR